MFRATLVGSSFDAARGTAVHDDAF